MNTLTRHRTHKSSTTLIVSVFMLCSWVLTANVKPAYSQSRKSTSSQPEEKYLQGRIATVVRADCDSIVIRWAPSSPGIWLESRSIGYNIDRGQLDSTGNIISSSVKRLNVEPIKPWELDEWKKRGAATEKNNRYAAIAVQLLFGKKFTVNSTVDASPTGGGITMMRNASMELDNRFGFALVAADNNTFAAEGLGMRFADTSVQRGARYVYRIYLAAQPKDYSVDTAFTLAQALPYIPEEPAIRLQAEGLDGRINLAWSQQSTRGYVGYNIYRSEDDGKTYKRLNPTPITGLKPDEASKNDSVEINVGRFIDSTITNYRLYRYQVRGITSFADETAPLNVASSGRDLTPPPAPQISLIKQTGKTSVRLEWTLPKTSETAKDLVGFIVMRSMASSEGFQPLPRRDIVDNIEYIGQVLQPKVREFVDEIATDEEPHYVVAAIDTAGNRSMSISKYAIIQDLEPPGAPVALQGKIDSLGVVRLSWNLGPEKNIIGYRVFMSNDPNHEFAQLTNTVLQDTVFTDTTSLVTLTKNSYYRVAAIDKRMVASKLSAILTLKRPDIVPPLAPTFTKVIVRDTAVSLAWQPSASDDVSYQLLSRRVVGAAWQVVKIVPPYERTYNDASISQQTEYEYRIVAVDSAGLRSEPSMIVKAHTYEQALKQTITGLKARYDSTQSRITLDWQYTSQSKNPNDKEWFIIYRASDNDTFEQYEAVNMPKLTFQDRVNPTLKRTYRYALAVTNGRSTSPLSEEVTVSIP